MKKILLISKKNELYPSVLDDGNTMAWYDYKENATVSNWGDKSGNGNDLLQATPTNQPTITADGVLFDGINNYMKANTFTLIQPEHVYIVFRQLSWVRYEIIFDGIGNTTGYLMQDASSPNLKISAGTQSAEVSLTLGNWGIVRALFNGAASKLILNNGTPVTGNFGAANLNGFTLGRGGTSGGTSNIEVKEIIIRKVADSASDETAIYNYLANKYSI